MQAAEFTLWIAYSEIEPFGPLHDELMAGQVCATLAETHRDTKRRPSPFTPSDFMPALRRHVHGDPVDPEEEEDLPPEQNAALLDAMFGFK
jgi:hypothetical protein